jgi:hypothetical protein
MKARSLLNPALVTTLLVMTTAAIGMESAISRYQINLRKRPIYAEPIPGPDGVAAPALRNLPRTTRHFEQVGQDRLESAEELETLGTDNYLTRFYAQREPGPDGRRHIAELHAAYYTGMIDTVPHVVERCMTAGGIDIVGATVTLDIPQATGGWLPSPDAAPDAAGRSHLYTVRLDDEYSTAVRGLRVNLPRDLTPEHPLKLRITEFAGPKGPHMFAGYFFIANGGWVATAEHVRDLAFDLQSDYAYYLKVQVGSSDVSSPEELASLAGALLDDLLGEIMTCVPDWQRVQTGKWPPDNPRSAQTLQRRGP